MVEIGQGKFDLLRMFCLHDLLPCNTVAVAGQLRQRNLDAMPEARQGLLDSPDLGPHIDGLAVIKIAIDTEQQHRLGLAETIDDRILTKIRRGRGPDRLAQAGAPRRAGR